MVFQGLILVQLQFWEMRLEVAMKIGKSMKYWEILIARMFQARISTSNKMQHKI